MPDLGITEALALAGLISSAGSAAYSGYQASQGGSSASTDAAKAASDAQSAQAAKDKQNAIRANLSNAQNQTGGALDNPGLTNLASLLAGYGGQAGGANPNAQTSSAATSNGLDSSGVGLQDFLNANPSAAFAGGSSQNPNDSFGLTI